VWGTFGPNAVAGVSTETVRIYSDYFSLVEAVGVLREMGYNVPGEKALSRFSQIVPPVADEHPLVASIRFGLPVKRGDLHTVFYELTLRELRAKGSSKK